MVNSMNFASSATVRRGLRSASGPEPRLAGLQLLFSRGSLRITGLLFALMAGMCISWLQPLCLAAQQLQTFRSEIGRRDAMLVIDPSGTPIFSQNADARLIPASILKLFTSLVGLHYLGEDYRFRTEFYLDDHSNLKVKGYGDPLLISEVLQRLAQKLAVDLKPRSPLEDLVLDDSYFAQPLTIPGITSSYEPYDAPNGALCANFNSVEFMHSSNGYTSAEPQTPLLPFALQKIKASGLKSGRIVFSHHHDEVTRYFGLLMQYFLNQCGISFRGQVKLGRVDPRNDHLIYTYRSEFPLSQVISKLLEFSNNFMINQILIETGAHVQGAPGTLEEGVTTALDYARNRLHLQTLSLVEGSGISRDDRISASDMAIVLKQFEPYRALMPQDGPEYYKTGTLHGVSTRAGFIQSTAGMWYRYVVMLNTPGKSARPIVERLRRQLE